MYARNVRTQPARPITPRVLSAAVLVTLALVSAACGDIAGPTKLPTLGAISSRDAGASVSAFVLLGNAALTCTNGGVTGNVVAGG